MLSKVKQIFGKYKTVEFIELSDHITKIDRIQQKEFHVWNLVRIQIIWCLVYQFLMKSAYCVHLYIGPGLYLLLS